MPAGRRQEQYFRQRGLTLVEVLVVVSLIAVLSGGIVFGSGMFSSSRERAAATVIVTGVRVGLTRANTSGKPVRLVLDIDDKSVRLEEASTTLMLREKEKDGKNTGGGAEAATEEEKKARAEAERILEAPRAPRPRFSLIKQLPFNDGPKGRSLGKGVAFRQVQTDHDSEPRTEGQAYIYFWPGGQTERAAIQLKQTSGSGEGLTVSVSPLTGRAKIERGKVELPEQPIDREYSERPE